MHAGGIKDLHFSNKGELLLSSSCDKSMKAWKIKNKKEKPQYLFSLTGHKNWVKSGQISTDGLHIGSGSDDKTVKLWDINTHKALHSYEFHTDFVN